MMYNLSTYLTNDNIQYQYNIYENNVTRFLTK